MTRKRTRGCDEPDNPVYVRINEVWHFYRRGFTVYEISRWLCLLEQEVLEIITDHRSYTRSYGLDVKSINHIDRLPTPAEIKSATRHLRKKDVAKRRAMPSKPYVTYVFLDRPVYSLSRRGRCGY